MNYGNTQQKAPTDQVLGKHRDGEDEQKRTQPGSHVQDALGRLLEEWMETSNGETLQKAHGNSEEDKNQNNANNGEEDNDYSRIRLPPPQKQDTSSQTKQMEEADLSHRMGGCQTDRNQPSKSQHRRIIQKTTPISNATLSVMIESKQKRTCDATQTQTAGKHRKSTKNKEDQRRKIENIPRRRIRR